MSHDERQLPVTLTINSGINSIALKSTKQGAKSSDHHKQADPDRHYETPASVSPMKSPQQSPTKQHDHTNTMAMQNLSANPLQQELKHTPPNTVNDTSWHNSTSNNPNDVPRQSMTSTSLGANINNNNNNNNNDSDAHQKIPLPDNLSANTNRSLNRSSQHHPNLQQYHGVFSPQIPASLQSSLASRVDQIIRTTLNDSPAYTPPTSKNSNKAANNNSGNSGIPNSTPNSNMPSPSSSSLIFNSASNMMGTSVSSAQPSIQGHTTNSSGGPISTTASQLASIYGPSLSATSDMSPSSGSNNLQTKTSIHSSASHSALAAAAALQSLNQSHIQRSQQQLAHTQQTPFLNAAPLATTKPPSNGSGTPVPQAAHGNNSSTSNHMPKLCISTPVSNSDPHKHPAFISENSSDFTLRMPNFAGNIKMPPHPSGPTHLPQNWQGHTGNPIGTVPRMMAAHGGGGPLPPFTSSSSPYALVGSHTLMGLSGSNSNTLIGQDGDSLSRLTALRNSNNNPSQMRDEKLAPPNLNSCLVKQGPPLSFDNLRGAQLSVVNNDSRSQPGPFQEQVFEETLARFAYDLLNLAVPGTNKYKRIIKMTDDMLESVENGEFYTNYEHIATGILTNTVLVPCFSIIDYLRRDRFSLIEVERIEQVHRKLSPTNFACLMHLVRQRDVDPSATKTSSGMNKSYDSGLMSLGPSMGVADRIPPGVFVANGQQMISLSPNRNDLMGPQGLDRSRRSSQSPGDSTRSQVGSNINNVSGMKCMTTPNQPPPSQHNPPQGSPLSSNQFGIPPYLVNHQNRNHQQQTSPQTSRSSPFHQPITMSSQLMPRPPRSHSTIGGLNIGPFNATYNSPPVRQPPAAHQNSSRPNLAALSNEVLPVHAHSTIPLSAHMSSKTPQTPRLPDNLASVHGVKGPPSTNISLASKSFGPTVHPQTNQLDFGISVGRQEHDSIQGLPAQTLLSLRHQEMNIRELTARRSITPHYPSSGMSNMGSLGGFSSMNMPRTGMIENQYVPMTSNNAPSSSNQNNNPLGLAHITPHRNSTFSNSSSFQTNSAMPPPTVTSADHQRQIITESSSKTGNPPSVTCSNLNTGDSQVNQYNSLMSAYQQQQIMLSNKLIDNGPGALPPSNMTNRSVNNSILSDTISQRSTINELMSVDTQPQRPIQPPTNSPKSTSQRSIITGSVASGSRKTKKTKFSPVVTNQTSDDKNCSAGNQSSCQTLERSATSGESVSLKADDFELHTNEPTKEMHSSDQVSARTTGNSNDRTKLPTTNTARGDETSAKIIIECSAGLTEGRSTNPQIVGKLPNISDQSISLSEKSSHDLSAFESETKASSSNDICGPNAPSQPSKYQKIFTKKAWLKNYDEEDQARLTEVTSQAVQIKMKVEANPTSADIPLSPPSDNNTRSPAPGTKSNGSSKSIRATKKRVKEVRSKKANSIASIRSNRPSKSADNDSEDETVSTSDLDDTDETDSVKSSGDKKLRRMPRRKVKSNPDREPSDQSSKEVKAKVGKDVKDRDIVRKRGKKDKSASETPNVKRKYNSDDESVKQKTKKCKEDDARKNESPSLKGKKRAGEKFLQTQPCYEIVPKAIRCLECRRVRQPSSKGDKVVSTKQSSKSNWEDFCRFFEFRKLRYNKSAQIVVAGFSDSTDAKDSDKQLWLPSSGNTPTNITYKVAKFILENIGDEFCNLVLQERSVIKAYEARSGDNRTTWKRAVNGLRELCDVCTTTLFNCHYVCERCGFVVCIDCHQSRSDNHRDQQIDDDTKRELGESGDNSRDVNDQPTVTNKKSKKDSHGWIFCAKNEEHSHEKLALAKIIAGDCLEEVWTMLHAARQRLYLKQCSCANSPSPVTGGWGLDKVSSEGLESAHRNEIGDEGSHSTLKGLLLATNGSSANGSASIDDFTNDEDSQDDSQQVSAAIEGCIASLNIEEQDCKRTDPSDTSFANNNTTHLKFCDGDLLVLTHSRHKENTRLFRAHWKQGKPVLVRDIHKKMNIDMWLPQFFSGKFGDYRSDLVDCRNGDIHRQSMRKYWDGFEPNPARKRAKEDNIPGHIPSATNEEPSAVSASYYSGSALWRLKDWPPGQDFKEILPEHYEDFMNNLPLSSYTTRTGRLNLACRLPKEMVKPDLGPKMYSAYGTTKFPERGTTNLHLDISDAVNVMVYVGGANPFSQGSADYAEIFEKTVDECHVDPLMKEQIRSNKLIPGALWHIFRPSDVHKMREFLNKVSDECKISQEKRTDPIHDQIWYLDQTLLDRLYREHGVKSYPVLQCMGDAIIIPAGAPHQVKNLQNCIKVANDFVSPENVRYCLQLTNEFRSLPDTHINQEDKLQIKNILYHSVKESIQYISLFESGKVSATDEPSDEDDC